MATKHATEIGSVELCELTGMTYRQLDYWVRNGVFTAEGEGMGSGSRRTYDASVIPKIKVLVRVARAFASKDVGQLSTHTYADIFNHADRGYVEVAPGIRITWPTHKEH